LRKLVALGVVLVGVLASVAGAAPPVQIATDTFVNPDSQHATLVEPDSFAFGSTIVAAVQAGRYTDGGASGVAWATSTNGGGSWTNGNLPGTTTWSTPPGPYARLSDPAVAYDAKHDIWLINSLALDVNVRGVAAIVNRSTDGGLTWGSPIEAATATGFSDFDKNWIVCDNGVKSAFYGNCYVEYDDFGIGNQVHVAISNDGGLTWHESPMPVLDALGGQPLVQPNGTVVMPIPNGDDTVLLALRSTDGGASWGKPKKVADLFSHFSDGNIRSGPLPSAEIDAAGRVYVVWADCRFRLNCSTNDLVLTSSSTGKSWKKPVRIPIDAKTSTIDHFLPGLAVDPATKGSKTVLGVVYYYYPVAACGASCQLNVGWVSSKNAGKKWTPPTTLAGPMDMDWLPDTTQGRMVGDYLSASFSGGVPHPVYVVANAPSVQSDCSSVGAVCDVSMYTASPSLAAHGALRPAIAEPVLSPAGERRAGRTSAR
jgi:BNR repeat protein